MVVEHCEWDFYMIFYFKEAEHLVAEHYEDFDTIFPLYGGSERDCRALWKRMGDWPYSYDKEQKYVQFSWFSSWQFHQKEGYEIINRLLD